MIKLGESLCRNFNYSKLVQLVFIIDNGCVKGDLPSKDILSSK